MDFGDLSSAPPHLLSIRSHGLISSFARLSQRGSQLLSSLPFLFPYQAPAALLSLLCSLTVQDSCLDTAFLSYLRSVIEKLVTC